MRPQGYDLFPTAHQYSFHCAENTERTLSIWLEIESSRSSLAAAEDKVSSTVAVDARDLYHLIDVDRMP
jgi:hypothetical protein